MNKIRRRKMITIIFILVVLTLVTSLLLYALRQNINLFYSPSDLSENKVPLDRVIRMGGMVVENSVIREQNSLTVSFKITDYKHIVEITTNEILPVLFREGQGIVALGKVTGKDKFFASEILAKHDENYMPPEVRSSLKEVAS